MKLKHLFALVILFLLTISIHAQTITQTNLPILILTSSGTIGTSNIEGSIKIINNSVGLNHPNDAAQFQGTIGIKFRGSSINPKKSYNIETWVNSSGLSLDTSLLGMPAENDWVLLANYSDRSFQRDLIGFYIHNMMGNYTPRMRLVEVILNNTYEGVYLFGEKIKRDINRLDISKLSVIDNAPPQITGGYILKIDNSTADYWSSQIVPPNAQWGQKINFHYDEPDASTISPVQKAYIKSYVDSFETALNGTNFQDTFSIDGWRYFAGKGSFEEYIITAEIMKSQDAYRLSTYLYKDKSKKLKMGPPWDLELSLFNTANCNTSKDTGWAYNYASTCGADTFLPSFWWKRLTQDSLFMKEMKCKYTIYRADFLDTNSIFHLIDSIGTILNAEQAITRNFTKWPTWGTQLVNEPLPVSTNYTEEITKIKKFLRNRLAFLDSKWLTPGCTLGIGDVANEKSQVTVSPNPVHESLTYKINIPETTNLDISVSDVLGRTFITKHLSSLTKGTHTISLDMSSLPNGIFFIHSIFNEQERNCMKVVKE